MLRLVVIVSYLLFPVCVSVCFIFVCVCAGAPAEAHEVSCGPPVQRLAQSHREQHFRCPAADGSEAEGEALRNSHCHHHPEVRACVFAFVCVRACLSLSRAYPPSRLLFDAISLASIPVFDPLSSSLKHSPLCCLCFASRLLCLVQLHEQVQPVQQRPRLAHVLGLAPPAPVCGDDDDVTAQGPRPPVLLGARALAMFMCHTALGPFWGDFTQYCL